MAADQREFIEIYQYAKKNINPDLIYRSLLYNSNVLTMIPPHETLSILHHIVSHANLDLFNKVIAIPNLRLILLTKSAGKPSKDILEISHEKIKKSQQHQMIYKRIKELNELDKFVEYAKHNQTDQCKQMLIQTDMDLANMKPPYRKYYLIHHLAYANNRREFDELRNLGTCHFNMLLLTSDNKTAAEVAFENHHQDFGNYLESLSPEMKKIREKHQAIQQSSIIAQEEEEKYVEQQLQSIQLPNNMLSCFTCPLTKELFIDPVVCADGFTYERAAIQQWLNGGQNRSPMTNMELSNTNLVPNIVIKSALDELREKEHQVSRL
ncbi:unnamed protein product [Didymodactylos carnosus]|uniref:U-box domain-containing protein n=1 Tax=Didymodactylos carnosus TaxID=1234261 RepID=A0A814FV20_9BILA|nr:unnamed protein product [Didymodactylos carnosus]CAF1149132.1 unnamed protein product [Didymodactylos carnosus]CAF3758474.1 unnamed protein product [Didymodactylos carnosus]CAF3953800.1 unnamed protein product [Didymodactylos carnosus]